MESTPGSLLDRLKNPNESTAWTRFVHLFTPLIYREARRAGLQPADAGDLVQDVLLVLSRKMPEFQYDRQRSFRGWLRTVTLNKLRENARRKVGRHPAGAVPADEVVDPVRFDLLLEESEYRRVICRQALDLMRAEFSPTTWQACWEHVVSGRSAAEVGAELGLSEGAVYVAKCRVLKRLRKELDGMLD